MDERTNVARSVLWAVAGAASLSVACFDTTNGFCAPDGTIKDPAREPYIVRRDNPMLTGRAMLGVQSERTEPGYTSVRVIAPDGVRVEADTPGALDETEGWTWTDASPSSTGEAFADTLRLPRVRLPMGRGPVTFRLESVRHRERTEAWPPGSTPPQLTVEVTPLDAMQVALDPRVLVLPVRVHRFVPPDSHPAVADERYFEQSIDPAAVETLRALVTTSPYSASVTVESGRLPEPAVAVDDLWTQCDIQFRLEAYEEIAQTDALERVLTRTCRCSGTARGLWGVPDAPSTPYLQALQSPETAMDVFVGGIIEQNADDGCLFGTRAITCGPSNSGTGGRCADLTNGIPFFSHNFVLRNADSVRTDPRVLAHELGHYLGSTHSPNEGRSQCLSPDDTAEAASGTLLMSPAAAGPTLTASQCARARCAAAHWLERFGRLTADDRMAVCGD